MPVGLPQVHLLRPPSLPAGRIPALAIRETWLSALAIALIVFGCTCSAAVLGIMLRKVLPEHHFDSESKDVVKLVMGLVATISALVLGLLIASANSSFNTQQDALQSISIDIIRLDRALALYGPETQRARGLLQEMVQAAYDRAHKNNGVVQATGQVQTKANQFVDALYVLSPKTEMQQLTRKRAFQLALSITKERLMLTENVSGSISWPFLAVLIGWIAVLFLGFGLLTRFHATSAATLVVGSASVAAAIFLLLELNEPYGGLIHLSDAPLREALALIGRPAL